MTLHESDFDAPPQRFVSSEYIEELSANQDRLLKEARAGEVFAVTALARLYERYPCVLSPKLICAIKPGATAAHDKLLSAKSMPNGRVPELNAMSYFGFERMPTRWKETRADGTNTATEMVKLRYAMDDYLSREEIIEALTKEYATTAKSKRGKQAKSKLDREDWPETIRDVERDLTAYIQHKFKGADEWICRKLARRSLELDWGFPEKRIDPDWDWEQLPAQ